MDDDDWPVRICSKCLGRGVFIRYLPRASKLMTYLFGYRGIDVRCDRCNATGIEP